MFRTLRPLSSLVKQHYSLSCTRYAHTAKRAKTTKPLRILFCGSDEFSIASLKALHTEHIQNPESIASIDVVCRPGKPAGRWLKTIREVPIKSAATELGLPVHERDTFTGWAPPTPQEEPINLIVAVSFGLLVPPRILNGAEYGGINVHPSLLPDLHGPAPLHHALIAGDKHIGVSLQTLHPSKFDQGMVLDQTPLPGFTIPNDGQITVSQLLDFITPKAADILLKGIKNRVFAPPVRALTPQITKKARHAPKITTEDRHVNMRTDSFDEVLRRHRVLGRLWTTLVLPNGSKKRISFEDFTPVPQPAVWKQFRSMVNDQIRAGVQTKDVVYDPEFNGRLFTSLFIDGENGPERNFIYTRDKNNAVIFIEVTGKGALQVEQITIEGGKKKPAFDALQIPGSISDPLSRTRLLSSLLSDITNQN